MKMWPVEPKSDSMKGMICIEMTSDRIRVKSNEDNVSYCFPKAVLIPEAVYAFKNTKDHCLKMNFEVFEDADGILMQRL